MKKIIEFIKTETVMIISWILAVFSMFFVRPSKEYFTYIDFKTLGLLLSLMFVTAGLKDSRVFEKIGNVLLKYINGMKGLKIVLIFLCFLSAMLITNDVALITFVPFSLYVLKKAGYEKEMIQVVVLQTIGANLGSMMTPFGNPQNLYLFSESGMSAKDFFVITIPYVIMAAVMLVLCCLMGKNSKERIEVPLEKVVVQKNTAIIYIVLFFVCVSAVFGVLPYYITLILVLLATICLDISLYKKVDYSLILTFVGFFIFIGNMGKIEAIQMILSKAVVGKEILVSILLSQIISNVPAALLLSHFTECYERLLIGLNIGGLGTLIASMASLISYKIYVRGYPKKKGIYIGKFTMYSVLFLIVLGVMAYSMEYR